MSVAVALDDLAAVVAERGAGYVLTSGSGRPHVTHAAVQIDGAVLRVEVGRTARRNAAARPEITVLWPPTDAGGYSLIVDGEATVEGSPDEPGVLVVVAVGAVLHRPAPGPG